MTYLEARWGLQYLAEETVGRKLAQVADREDEAMTRARKALGG